MFHGCKLTDTPTDAIHINTCVVSHGHCCHYILKIVCTKKLQLSCSHNRNLLFLCAENNLVSSQENTLFKFSCTGKIYSLWHNVFAKFTKDFILIIQHTYIFRTLVAGDQLFHADILSHCMMTVQMILCDIQNGAYPWSKFPDSLKLEAADLCNRDSLIGHLQ